MRVSDRDNLGENGLGRMWVWIGLSVLSAAVFCGCSKRPVSANETVTVEADYSRGQIMAIAATERNRYQNIYTSQLWSIKADDSGVTFEEKLTGQIEQFLVELAATNLMADEHKVELTSQEKDSIKALSRDYYKGLSEGDRYYTEVTEDEIYDLYCKYYRADKLVGELTKDENLEVSDAEAKVIHVQRIKLESREQAEVILEQVNGEKADFASIAIKNSKESQIESTLEWRENMSALEQAAFELEQDEISSVLEQDGKYYILKCIDAYDDEATAARKDKLAQEKKTKAFLGIYQPFVKEHVVKLKTNVRDVVDFSGGEECTTDNFFQLYHEYFSK